MSTLRTPAEYEAMLFTEGRLAFESWSLGKASLSGRVFGWYRVADLALVFNTFVWGSTFILVKRALDDSSAILFVALRFLIATLVMAWVFRRRLNRDPVAIRGGLLAGVCLFAGYAFQTAGLKPKLAID